MRRLYITIMCVLLALSDSIKAETLTADSTAVEGGSTASLTVRLTNSGSAWTAYQFVLTLPDGISLVANNGGIYTGQLSSRHDSSFKFTIHEQSPRQYAIVCYSSNGVAVSGTSGVLLTLPIQTDNTEEELHLFGNISEVTLSDLNGNKESPDAYQFPITVTVPPKVFALTYIVDGETFHIDSVTEGSVITPVEEPIREGHTFSGWSEIPATMPTNDVTITGTFTPNSYLLTYIVDGDTIQSNNVVFATTITPLAEPTRIGETFSGWSEIPSTMPAHDVTVIGTFSVDSTFKINNLVFNYDKEKGGYEFAGTEEPEAKEVTIPQEINGKPVVSVPEATFAGNTQLQVLIWDSEAPVDAACFGTPEEHGNLLVFVSGDVEVTYQGNVIRNGVAKSITLYDGRPFSNPQAFIAEYISITKDFSKETIIGSTSGWETFVVPFEVDSITTEDGQLIAPFGADANTDKHFWLAKMDANVGFTKDSLIRANVPYIISMPNSEGYIEEYRINGKVTFHGRNVVVQPTANATSNAGPLFGLVPTYQEVAAADSVFVLNDEPYEADGITWPAGSVFVRSSRAARPFEAYTYANVSNGGNVKGYIPLDELANGIQRPTPDPFRNGGVAGAMYDLSGRKISVSSVHSASSVLPKGVYIMDGQKVLVK